MEPSENIEHYAEVPVDVVLELDKGSVIKLGRSAGENIDIRVHGTLIGFGEIVIIEDSMGVRITDFSGEE